MQIEEVYGREDAFEVIRLSMADYSDKFGSEEDRLQALREILLGSIKKPGTTKRRPRR